VNPIQPARLILKADGTPYSDTYGDVYHSAHGGPEQARHVFLGGNDLPNRWRGRERFVILETGFGLGLNFLATCEAWADDPARCGRLHFISVEKHPFSATDLARAHAAWPQFAALAAELRGAWPLALPGFQRIELAGGRIVLTLVFGDATRELHQIDAEVDAFYLDGFSPARNPELWTADIARALARLAAPGATLATWSVAGHVREALDAAGFELERRPGFAGKRQMLSGRNRSRRPARYRLPGERRAIVIGGGLAGSLVAERLAALDWQVVVFDRHDQPGQGASGNLAGVLRPQPSVDDNVLARLTRAGFFASLRRLRALGEAVRWSPCGVLHRARDAAQAATQRRAVEALCPPPEYLQFLQPAGASLNVGAPVEYGGWWFSGGGWVQPPSWCRAALAAWPNAIAWYGGCAVTMLRREGEYWQALDNNGQVLAEAPQVIVAAGHEASRLAEFAALPIRPARGQVSHLPEGALPPLNHVVCGGAYLSPPVDGWHALGATTSHDDLDPGERLADHAANLALLAHLLPGAYPLPEASTLTGRVGFRPTTPDRLPIVGALPGQPGLHAALGYGARGLVWAALMAELLAAQLEGTPLPIAHDLIGAVAPRRLQETTSNRLSSADRGLSDE